jgi:nitrite reductase/ring-hydroxylating ferredoxin subunit
MNERRVFLQMLGAGALASACSSSDSSDTGGSTGSGSVPATLPENYTKVGTTAEVMAGTLTQVAAASVLLGRDDGGVYAMTSICPHANCDMCLKGLVIPKGIVCNCHGSEFDPAGNVTNGPALKSLVHYDCAIDAAGNIGVDKATEVEVEFRAPVP